MKALIAAACVAVIAAVGYYFWSEYRNAKLDEARAQQISVSNGCAQTLKPENFQLKALRHFCLEKGYISQAQFDAVEDAN